MFSRYIKNHHNICLPRDLWWEGCAVCAALCWAGRGRVPVQRPTLSSCCALQFHQDWQFATKASGASWCLGKTLFPWRPLHLGIAQIAIGPPPALNRALWGTFFRAIFYHSAGLYASENGNIRFGRPLKKGSNVTIPSFRCRGEILNHTELHYPKQAHAHLNLDSSSINKCPKPYGQAFRPPQKQGYAHLNLDNSSLNKCPKPSGQAFRPPQKNKDMPIWTWTILL